MRHPVWRALAAVIVGACIASSAACADSADDPVTQVRTVAFLRAVPAVSGVERALLDELRQAGFVRGRNLRVLAVDRDDVYPDPDEARTVVSQWRDDGVDLIVASSSAGAALVREVAPEVDVLFVSNDPVAMGLVEDESAPGGRLTGLVYRVPTDRLLDVARRVVPDLETVGLAYPDGDAAAIANREVYDETADRLGIGLVAAPFDDPSDLSRVVADLAAEGVEALALSSSPTALMALEEARAAAAEQRLPVIAMTERATFALVSLSPEDDEVGRQLGRQAVRLLTGASAADVPVEVPRRFVLTINASAAEELGLRIPDDVLVEAQVVLP